MTPSDRARALAIRRCACFSLRKAARAMTQLYDDILRPSGLRDTQFSLLTVIGAFGRLSITQLAEEAVMDRTTLTRNLNLLKRGGLIRIQVGEDARVREVELTPAAQKRLAAAFPYWEKAQTQVTKQLGPERLDRLLADLSAAIEATGN